MLTQTELKSLLHYDAETGIFTRLVTNNNWTKIGDIAGGKNNHGHIQIAINGKRYMAHRLVWVYVYGYSPKLDIDHINGIKHDNRLCNLREATRQQNSWNRGKSSNNTSGFKGVSFNKRINRWSATVLHNGKNNRLGHFTTPELAHEAYKQFAIKNHGEFARF